MDKSELAMLRAEQASQVLNNPVFEQAFADIEAAIFKAWKELNPSDERRSEYSRDLHRMLRAAEHLKKCLAEHITTGKLAKHAIEGRRNLIGKRALFDK
jgi:hypothetical protein